MLSSMQKEVLLFGGSFNPIHNGHLGLCRYVLSAFDDEQCREVWLMVSPLNPLKVGSRDLISAETRLEMTRQAVHGISDLHVTDVEIRMQQEGKPSYSIDTLDVLRATYGENYRFKMLVGGDNLQVFDRWKDYQRILDEYGIVVYPREGEQLTVPQGWRGVELLQSVPLFDVSSTQIRNLVREGRWTEVERLVPPQVMSFIQSNELYQ